MDPAETSCINYCFTADLSLSNSNLSIDVIRIMAGHSLQALANKNKEKDTVNWAYSTENFRLLGNDRNILLDHIYHAFSVDRLVSGSLETSFH